jgi:mitochondrial Rho GTPase 1
MQEHVNILLIGDEGVGKSSLLSAFISRHFPQEVPHVMIDAKIPPNMVWTNIFTTVMDSSSQPSDREILKHKIALADSIIAVYDLTRPDTFDNLSRIWLPLIQEVGTDTNDPTQTCQKSVIVLGNKQDLLVDDEDQQKLAELLKEFPFVFCCLQCSAAQLSMIDEAFYKAVLIVVYPFDPLYDLSCEEFTPICRRALLRIFRIFDFDNDNLLNDAEISQLHNHCFSEDPISEMEILNLKKRLGNVPGILYNNCLTFEGFIRIILDALLRHNLQLPWTVLHECGYDEHLQLQVRNRFNVENRIIIIIV